MQKMIPVYHPLLDLPLPDVDWLKDRCETEASRVLDTARRLAGVRVQQCQQMQRNHQEMVRTPWAEPHVSVKGDMETEVLLQTDLLRALLVQVPDIFTAAITGIKDNFEADRLHWKATAECAPSIPISRLDRVWAKRWALTEIRCRGFNVGVEDLIGSLDFALAAIAEYSTAYVEGLVTKGEFFNRLIDALPRRNIRFESAVAPAYLDRHNGMAALNSAMACRAAGTIIWGPPSSGRTSLALAWAERQILTHARGTASSHSRHFLALREDIRADGLSVSQKNGPFFFITRDTAWMADEALYDQCASMLSVDPRHLHPLVPANGDDEATIRANARAVPLAEVTVPPIEERDLIPIWLCQKPRLENMGWQRPHLPGLLALLSKISRPDAVTRRMNEAAVRHSEAPTIWDVVGCDSLDHIIGPSADAESESSWELVLRKVRSGRNSDVKLSADQASTIDRFVGEIGDLEALIELEERLP